MIDLGLGRITHLVRDHTTKLPWKAIHIAGTNGKGSVAAYLSALFHRKGIRVGRFTSPHLIDRWDCITLNQSPVAKQKFLDAEHEILFRDSQGHIKATEFEMLTATAFELFSRERLQVGVIECGMGGLRDATNVLDHDEVLCSVITKIGLDHQSFLGNGIEDIAKEKAGIVKTEVPVVVDSSNKSSVRDCIKRPASAVGSSYYESDPSSLSGVSLTLPPHQRDNLSVAIKAFQLATTRLDDVETSNLSNLSDQDIEAVITEVRRDWKGRLQWLSIDTISDRKTDILLDGAHNPQSAETLRDYVATQVRKSGQPITWILAMSAGKDMDGVVSLLLQPNDRVIICPFGSVDGMPWVRAQDPEGLAEVSVQYTNNVTFLNNPKDAIDAAVQATKDSDPIVISGSLYLVSDVLRLLRDAETTR